MDHSSSSPTAPARSRPKTGLFVSAFVGVLAALLLSFIPFSTVLGGLLAGYLYSETTGDGALVGGVAGIIMFAPFFLILYILLGAIALSGAPPLFSGIVLAVFVAVGFYTIGASIAGGLLGAYLAVELDRHIPVLDDL